MATLLDSFSEAGVTNYDSIEQNGAGDKTQAGNTFKTPNDGINYTLDTCDFYLRRVGAMTGTTRARVFALTGTPGTDGKPTGAALASSDTVDTSTIGTSAALITFTYSGANRITLTANTDYCVLAEVPSGNGDNATIYLEIGRGGSEAGANRFDSTDNGANYNTVNTQNYAFHVYGVTGGGGGTLATKKTLLGVGL